LKDDDQRVLRYVIKRTAVDPCPNELPYHLSKEMETSEAEIFTAEVTSDLAKQLDTHRHGAYTEWTEKLDN